MSKVGTHEAVKLNIGCGGRVLPGYINVDSDSLEQLKARYPDGEFPEGVTVFDYDIFALPYEDESVDEVRADALVEHLSFLEEPKFFAEVRRVLKPGGVLIISTPDFEETLKVWLRAEDDWKDFFRNDDEAIAQQHWFGTYTYDVKNRWGYPIAMIFGSQNGAGQHHKNAYTVPKLRAIFDRLGFDEEKISRFRWKGRRDLMILARARKR